MTKCATKPETILNQIILREINAEAAQHSKLDYSIAKWPSSIQEGQHLNWREQRRFWRIRGGVVIQLTPRIAILDNGRYKECFSLADVHCGEVRLV